MGQNFTSEPVVEKETERDQNDMFNVAVSSCQGWRTTQEDNHSMILDMPGGHKASFFAVYDGHGSARVSKHASEGLWRHIAENDAYIKGNFKEALESAFLTFDKEVKESYSAQLAGTTAVCVLIVDNIVYCANIGDSRAVASVNCECVNLSFDHKPKNPEELKRIMAAGGYVIGNRVNGNLALSRAFGDFHYKGNDQLPPDQQIVSPCPEVKLIDLNDDVDFIVLACDGIWDVLRSEEVVEFVIKHLEKNTEPGMICELLTARCLAPDYELEIGCDNMTVLLVCYTRGRSWSDFCTDIFNKNTKRLGVTRTRESLTATDEQPSGSSEHMQDTTSATTASMDISDNKFSNLSSSDEPSFSPDTMSSGELRVMLHSILDNSRKLYSTIGNPDTMSPGELRVLLDNITDHRESSSSTATTDSAASLDATNTATTTSATAVTATAATTTGEPQQDEPPNETVFPVTEVLAQDIEPITLGSTENTADVTADGDGEKSEDKEDASSPIEEITAIEKESTMELVVNESQPEITADEIEPIDLVSPGNDAETDSKTEGATDEPTQVSSQEEDESTSATDDKQDASQDEAESTN